MSRTISANLPNHPGITRAGCEAPGGPILPAMAGIGPFSRRLRDRHDDHLPLAAGPVSNGEFVPAPEGPRDRKVNELIRTNIDDAARRLGVDRRRFLQGAGAVAASLAAFELAGCASPSHPQAAATRRPGRAVHHAPAHGRRGVPARP